MKPGVASSTCVGAASPGRSCRLGLLAGDASGVTYCSHARAVGLAGVTLGRLLVLEGGHEPHLLRGARGGDATGVFALSVSDSVSASASFRAATTGAGSHTVLVSNSAGKGRGGKRGGGWPARMSMHQLRGRCWSNSSLVNGPGCAASPTLTPAQIKGFAVAS